MSALDAGRKDLAGTPVVEIPETEYKQLKRDSEVLAALHAGGVDNWDWYDESLKDLREEDDD